MDDTLKTSETMLLRLRNNPDDRDWELFFKLYSPLVMRCLRKAGVPSRDIADLGQEVMAILINRLPKWEYDPSRGRFRGYVKTIVRRKAIRHFDRMRRQHSPVGGTDAQAILSELPDDRCDIDKEFELAWQRRVFEIACEKVKARVNEDTWTVYEQVKLLGRPVQEVAEVFAWTPSQVTTAAHRVKGYLREEVALLDE